MFLVWNIRVFHIVFFPVITTQQSWNWLSFYHHVKTKITKPTFWEHRPIELNKAFIVFPDNVDRISYRKTYAFNQKQDDGKSLMYVRIYFGFLLKLRDHGSYQYQIIPMHDILERVRAFYRH